MIGRVGAQDTLHDGEDIGVGTLCHATFTMENGLSTIRFMCLLRCHHSSKQRDRLDVTIQPTPVGQTSRARQRTGKKIWTSKRFYKAIDRSSRRRFWENVLPRRHTTADLEIEHGIGLLTLIGLKQGKANSLQ